MLPPTYTFQMSYKINWAVRPSNIRFVCLHQLQMRRTILKIADSMLPWRYTGVVCPLPTRRRPQSDTKNDDFPIPRRHRRNKWCFPFHIVSNTSRSGPQSEIVFAFTKNFRENASVSGPPFQCCVSDLPFQKPIYPNIHKNSVTLLSIYSASCSK